MSFFSTLFKSKNKLPIKKIEKVYTGCFQSFSQDINKAIQKQGVVSIDSNGGIHLDINNATRVTNILTEYALFLKACTIHILKKKGIAFSESELNAAFPIVNEMFDILRSVPENRRALNNRIDDYLISIENKQTCGYCMQNDIAPHHYSFLDTACKIDNVHLAFFFVDCFYFTSHTEKFITSEQIPTLKSLTFNISQKESTFYANLAADVKIHADLLEKELSKIL
jgi:hypothetical protein